MNSSFQSIRSFCFASICVISLALVSCENPGSVGSGLSDSRGEVVTDTVFVDGMETVNTTTYSGNLSFFAMGKYEDQLFGTMTATGYMKPTLPGADNTVSENATIQMRLLFENENVYGDTLSDQQYSLYEINELWRGTALKINDDLATDAKLGEFSISTDDSLDINLNEINQDWVDRYIQFANTDTTNRDSLYKNGMYGLAVVPENANKIVPLTVGETRFTIQNPLADTFRVSTSEWGYTLNRDTNTSFPQGSVPLYNTYEQILNFGDLGIEDLEVETSGLSRAELVLYENTSTMEQTLESEPFSVIRPHPPTAYLQYADPANLPENIDPGVPVDNVTKIPGVYNENDGSYRFDITQLVGNKLRDGLPGGREFYITFPNDGTIKPSLIYSDGSQVPTSKRPKIVITYLKNSSN